MIYKVIKPRDNLCSAFESLSYISINDPILDKIIENHIHSIMKKINNSYE